MKMKKKELSSADNQVGVILEDINSKFDLLVDGHKVLDKKIDHVKSDVGDLRQEMNYKFETVIDELRIIRNELKEKVGRDEFTLLEKRMTVLEKALAFKK